MGTRRSRFGHCAWQCTSDGSTKPPASRHHHENALGAQGEIRTLTVSPPEDFESPASAVPPLGHSRARHMVAHLHPIAPTTAAHFGSPFAVTAPRRWQNAGGPAPFPKETFAHARFPWERSAPSERADLALCAPYALLTEPNSSMSSLVRATMASRPGFRSLRGS